MLNTYVVEGGVGKCTAFTALLPKLKKKSEKVRQKKQLQPFFQINLG